MIIFIWTYVFRFYTDLRSSDLILNVKRLEWSFESQGFDCYVTDILTEILLDHYIEA